MIEIRTRVSSIVWGFGRVEQIEDGIAYVRFSSDPWVLHGYKIDRLEVDPRTGTISCDWDDVSKYDPY